MSILSAIDALEELFSEKLRVLTPFRAVVVAVSGGLVTITRENATSSDGMAYAHLAGFLLTAGDVVACLNYNGQPIILGRIQNAVSTTLGLDGKLLITSLDTAGAVANSIPQYSGSAWAYTAGPTFSSMVVNGGMRMGGAGVPTVTAGTSAGTGASVANVTGSEYNGYFELTAGTAPGTGQVAHVQFANALGNNHYAVILQDESGTLTLKSPYVRDKTTTDFYVGMNVAPTAAQVYKVSYVLLGRTT